MIIYYIFMPANDTFKIHQTTEHCVTDERRLVVMMARPPK